MPKARKKLATHPEVYRHYKTGGLYRFLYKATDADDLKDLAVYVSLETGHVWVRPYAEFTELLPDEDGELTIRRFMPVSVQAGLHR